MGTEIEREMHVSRYMYMSLYVFNTEGERIGEGRETERERERERERVELERDKEGGFTAGGNKDKERQRPITKQGC